MLIREMHCLDVVDRDSISPLYLAATFSKHQTKALLRAGASPLVRTYKGLTVLYVAARLQQANIIRIILEHLETALAETILDLVNAKDILRRTSLYYACALGRIKTVKMLI
jgi:ankyrin repeat protein